MVEAQHRVSTLKLVDTLSEQEILEELLERTKPPRPDDRRGRRLHYLLATPFRYPPLRHGSRFGTATERGIWYGSLEVETVMAEVAWYRFVFLEHSKAEFGAVETEHTLFHVEVATERGVDLRQPPFAVHRARLASPNDWNASQPTGSAMRRDGVAAFLFHSARRDGGTNVGLFDPTAFAEAAPKPRTPPVYKCVAGSDRVFFRRLDLSGKSTYSYARADLGPPPR